MRYMRWIGAAAAAAALLGLGLIQAAPPETPFADAVGAVAVGDAPKADGVLQVPFIFWGGDIATFLANGGLDTKPDTTFGKLGLKFKLTPGDDFLGQVKDYLAGKTPFLRGTMSQLGQAVELLDKDPRTQPVVFLQLTWSKGDHLVAREGIKTLADLKGKKIALQRYGPHVGFLNDELSTAGLKWDDVTVVWTSDITGDKGPAETFRKDKTVDACFVVTPDMLDLTGGLTTVGTGADKTVKGAHVVDSTQYKNRSIADVYACRKDFYDKNKDLVQKFAAGYLKACEDLVDLKTNHTAKDRDKAKDARYVELLKLAQNITPDWKAALPGTDDVHALISDADLICLPGNYKFFTKKGDPISFENMMKAATQMAVDIGSAKTKAEMLDAGLDYDKLIAVGDLKLPKEVKSEDKFTGNVGDLSDKDVIYSFTVQYGPNETKFDQAKYAKEFQKAVDEAAKYGHAVLAIRGHVDPFKTLKQFVDVGKKKGFLTQTQDGDVKKYFLDGKPLDLADTKKVLDAINSKDLTGVAADDNPKVTVEAAKGLSEERAKNFQTSLVEYATGKGLTIDKSQFKSEGVGIAEPVIGVPHSEDEAAQNRRVELRILKVSPEAVTASDYKGL